MYNSLNEIPIFLYCLRTGLLIGICYEMFRLFRLSGNRIVNGIIDAAFGIIAVSAAALTLLYCNDGILRAYEFAGMFIGAFIYYKYPGRLIRMAFAAIRVRMEQKRRTKHGGHSKA